MSKTILENGFFNMYESKGLETPDEYKGVVKYFEEYYARRNLLGCEMSSFSLLLDGLSLNKISDDLINEDGSCIIPEGVYMIRPDCCSGNKKIKSLVLPSSLRRISTNAFYDLPNLQSVTLSHGIKSLERDAFHGLNANYLNLPGSLGIVKGECLNMYYIRELVLNYGISKVKLSTYGTIEELWLPPTFKEVMSYGYLSWVHFAKLKKVHIFKGNSEVLPTFIKYEKNVRVIEETNGWGNWKENAVSDANAKIAKLEKDLIKLRKRADKSQVEFSNLTFMEQINKLERNINYYKEYIDKIQNTFYD
jgi:hypothetical protein